MVKVLCLAFPTVLLVSQAACAQSVTALFARLDAHYEESPPGFPAASSALQAKVVSEEYPGGVRIHYPPGRVSVIDSSLGGHFSPTGVFWPAHESPTGETATRILEAPIGGPSQQRLVFDFSMGPSMDPHFAVHRVSGDSTEFLGKIQCLDLFVPGNGALYAAGHVNGMFDLRRRYTIECQHSDSLHGAASAERFSLLETPQPFYWVGLETVATAPVPLFATQFAATASDTLPRGTPITVLLNSDDRYLLRLPYGVTAWAAVDRSYYTPIQHLLYRGD